VALGAYSLIGAGVGFAIVRWAKTAENATDYSVMNTGKHILWLPTRREEKYKAKQANDTFFVRLGDLLSAGVVFVGTTYFALGIRGAAMVNVVLVAFWLAVAVVLLRQYHELSAGNA
jgi:AAA family ATP:ADP antiporter